MKNFTFDLQRFANVWKIGSTYYTSLKNALNAAKDGDTIVLLQDTTENGLTISKSVTIELSNHTYTIDEGSPSGAGNKGFTLESGKVIAFQNGTITPKRRVTTTITNYAALTLNNVNIDENVSSPSSTASINILGKTVLDVSEGSYLLENGLKFALASGSSANLNVPGDDTATVTLPSGSAFTVTYTNSSQVAYSTTGSSSIALTLNATSNSATLSDLAVGTSFSIAKDGGKPVTYTITSGGFKAECDGILKVWEGDPIDISSPMAIDELNFNDPKFVQAILANTSNDNTLTVSANDLTALTVGDTIKIVDNADYYKSYGLLRKVSDDTFALTRDSTNAKSLSGITIKNGLTAQFSSDFANIPITVVGNSSGTTQLQSATAKDFTLTSDAKAQVSIEGSITASLTSGTIKTSNAAPTIKSGNFSVYYEEAKSKDNGINVVADSNSTQITGIDSGESFNVGGKSYYRDEVGLRTGSDKVYTSNVAIVSANDKSISVDLTKLRDSVSSFISPDGGVLEIGNNNINTAVIVNDKNSPTIKYAELFVDSSSTLGNFFNLRAADDGNVEAFLGAVDTISLTGGIRTSVNKKLADGVTIVAGKDSIPDATFKVTECSNSFTVNLKSDTTATFITNATGITLLSGTIIATEGQTITLGDSGRKFTVTSSSEGINVSVSSSGETMTATITGAANDTFTIDGQSYVVGEKSDGVTFTVTPDKVTASDLLTSDGDYFTYGGATYSVRGAGFIVTQSGKQSIWSALSTSGERTGNHSLTGGAVVINNLPENKDHVWDALATVEAENAAATLPPSDSSTTVTLIGDDFKETYGILTKDATSCTLTKAETEPMLSTISVGSGVDDFTFGSSLTGVQINSSLASFVVTEDIPNDGYKVTLTSGATNAVVIEGATRASLISGSLQADSGLSANVFDNRIIMYDDAEITLTATSSDASINGLAESERFSIEGADKYTMSKVGLVADKSQRYLIGTRVGNPIILSELNGDTPWGGLIDKDEITITASTGTALIVDFNEENVPDKLYADYTNIDGTQSLKKSNSSDPWDNNVTINIAETTVNFTSYFKNKKIKGVRSAAEFTIEDEKAFQITDVATGAIIGSATNISQTAGTISLSSGQVIHSTPATLTANKGDVTFTVNDKAATIGAIENTDRFTVGKGASNVTYTRNTLGLVTNDDRLWTAADSVNASVAVAELLKGDNWTNTVYISGSGTLSVPPTTGVTSPWIILSNDKEARYGTLTQSGDGYSITANIATNPDDTYNYDSEWLSTNTISMGDSPVTLSSEFTGANIRATQSGAAFTATVATGETFTVNDSKVAATITGATKINQTSGVISPLAKQNIIVGEHSIVSSADDAINVSVSGGSGTINALSEGDTFVIDGTKFEILADGVVRRNGSELWQNENKTYATVDDLLADWFAFVEIEPTSTLTINNALVGGLQTGKDTFIVDKDNHNNIYGTITKNNAGKYTLTTDGKTVDTFTAVTVSTEIDSVTFAKEHFITNEIPITAGNATFTVTDRNVNSFTANYDGKNASVGTATAISLTNGTLALKNTKQTITAGSQEVNTGGGEITVNYDGTTLTIASLDSKNDSVILGTDTYTYNTGDGMTITIADGVTKVNSLNSDTFTLGDATFTKTDKGFVKKNNSSNAAYMWTNEDVDVEKDGVDVKLLKGSDSWTAITAISGGNIVVDGTQTSTVVLVGDLNDPTAEIYGTYEVDGSNYSLVKDSNANTAPASITVNSGITVAIDENYNTTSITPKNNSTIKTTGHLVFTPANGTTFTVNDSTYTMTSDGLTLGDMIWSRSDNQYTLPNDGDGWLIYDGTVSINAGESVRAASDKKISVTEGAITATAAKGAWTSLGGLTKGDIFTIDETTYQVLGDGNTLAQLDAEGNVAKLLDGSTISEDDTLSYDAIVKGTYVDVLTLDTDNGLNLSAKPSTTPSTASVLGRNSASEIDPTKKIATVTCDGESYTLTADKDVGEMTSVTLGAVKSLTTAVETPIKTPTGNTYTINGKSFVARTALEIMPIGSTNAKLTGGTVTLTAGNDVTALDDEITAQTGTITVNVNGETVTIGNLASGRVFKVGNNDPYTMTAIGFNDGKSFKEFSGNSITTNDLSSGWENMIKAPSGALTIKKSVDSGAVVNSPVSVRYGTLTKSGTNYTYAQNGSNTLNSIDVSGVTATFSPSALEKDAQITAGDATLTLTASGDFTINAATSIPSIKGASAITLTAGTIAAEKDIPVTIGKNTITATNGEMTVGINSSNKVFVSELNAGDTFKVGTTNYEITSAGQLYDTDHKQIVTSGYSKGTFIVDDIAIERIIAPSGTTLDISGETESALIYNNVTNPTTKLADLTVTGTRFDLKGTDNNTIKTVKIADDSNLTVDFVSQVNVTKGVVNGQTYNGTNELTINATATDTEKTSTLYAGTITLDTTNPSAKATNDSTALTVTSGTITATASAGKFTEISGLDTADETFTFGGKNYTVTAIGLTTGNTLKDISGGTVSINDLANGWQTIIEAPNGALTINNSVTSGVVVDDSLTTKYGTLTKSGSNYTYTQNGSNKLSGVDVSEVAVTFSSSAAGATITANDATFTLTASGDFKIDATESIPDIDGASAITLTAGTIATEKDVPVTIGKNTITATNGDMTVGINSNSQAFVSELNAGDTFTVGTTNYEVTSAGQLYDTDNKQIVTSGYSDGTLTIDENFKVERIIAPSGTTLDLSGETESALVYNSITNPTTKLADLTVSGTRFDLKATDDNTIKTVKIADGSNLTVDFVSKVNVKSGIVNGQAYNGTDELTVNATAKTSTLHAGTITLDTTNSSAKATNDSTKLTVASGTITATASAGKFTEISGLDTGETFTFGGKEYTMTAIGLSNGTAIKKISDGTVSISDLDNGWQTFIKALNGALTIDSSLTSGVVVDDSLITEYGELKKSGSNYTYKQTGSNTLNSIEVSKVAATFPLTSASATIKANDAILTLTATDDFKIDATSSIPNIDGASAINLTEGTIFAPSEITVTLGDYKITATKGEMTLGWDNDDVKVSDLNTGDTFKVGETSYEMTTVGLYDAANQKMATSGVSDDLTTFTLNKDTEFGNVVALDTDGTLDLTGKPSTAFVVGRDESGEVDPTKSVATVTYKDESYTLTASANIENMTAVKLNTVKNLTTAVEKPVKTSSKSTYTINGKSFVARTALEIMPVGSNNARLTSGTVTLAAGNEVATPDEKITATTGTITVGVSGENVTIGNLASSRVFSVGDNSYTMTAIGFNDGTSIKEFSGNSITTKELSSGWENMIKAPSGALTIDNSVESGIVVNNPVSVKYGELTKSGSNYTFEQNGSNTLNSINVSGIKATFPLTSASATITANDATFTLTASSDFTINAVASISDIDGASAINLTAGTIAAEKDVPVTIGKNTITATNGDMTVGINSSSQIFVSDLNVGDTFTVGDTHYEVTSAGQLYDTDNKQIITSGYSNGTFIVDDFVVGKIIAPSGTTLDLSSETQSALVYNSVENPTTKLADLTVTGTRFELKGTDDNTIKTIKIADGSNLTVDFVSQVKVTSGIVNEQAYNGTNELTINATATTSTLYTGTITLDTTIPSAKATNDSTELKVSDGTITATATAGKFTEISGLDTAGEAFTFGGKDYTMTAIGLSNGTALKEISDGTVSISDLANGWQTFIEAPNGELTIDSSVTSGVVVDDSLTTKYGTLTKSGNNYTFEQNGSNNLNSINVSGVEVTFSSGAAGATITANDATFTLTASGDFTINAVASIPDIDGASAINLTAGTIAAEKDVPVTIGKKTITATNGEMTVGINSDNQIFVSDLNAGDTFTVDNTNYEVTSAEQLYDTDNKQIIKEESYSNGTFIVDKSVGDRIIAPSGTTLDLSSETQSALVYNSVTNPTTKLADLTVTDTRFELKGTDDNTIKTIKIADGSNLTVDFVSQVKVTSGIVNGQAYNGTNELTINATAESSTLYAGTITLDTTIPSGKATNDSTELEVTSGTITAKAKAGKFTEISGLDTGETFTFGGKNYTVTAIGLSNGTALKEISNGKVSINDLSKDWQTVIEAPSGALTIDSSVTSGVVVDDSLTTKYGELTKSGNNYSYTQNGSNTLNNVNISGVTTTFPSSATSATITANDATFTLTAIGDFTIDATSSIPGIEDASAINLTAGTIAAEKDVPVTIGKKTITATNGEMTVGINSSSQIFVGDLNSGDTFTVDTTNYEITSAGQLYDTSNKQIVTSGYTDGTFIVDDFVVGKIIAPSGTTLDLSSETQNALVYNSVENPTTKLADLIVTGTRFELKGTDDNTIKTIKIADGSNLTVDFVSQVKVTSGTINGQAYNGTEELTINATATTSTLYAGTITLDTTIPSAKATNDSTELKVSDGTITATATAGKFTEISDLDTAGEAFTFGGKDYTMTAIGLSNGTALKEISDSTVSISDLANGWQTFIEAPNGELTIDSSVTSGVVVDDSLTTKYGTLKKSGNNYTYTQNGSNTLDSIEISGVSVTFPSSALEKDAKITAGDATLTLTATGEFKIDATSSIPNIEGASAINLTAGTIAAEKDVPVTIGKNTITATNGDMTVGINSDNQVFVSDLNAGDTFTVGNTNYEVTSAGQLYDTDNKQIIKEENYSNGTFIVDKSVGDRIIAPSGTTLDISGETQSALVYNSVTNPTTKLADLTVTGTRFELKGTDDNTIKTVKIADGSNLTVDFISQVNVTSGTVNGQAYNGTEELTINATETTSTLYAGTITLDTTIPSVKATNDSTELEVTSGTITATATAGKFTEISGLDTVGETFTFGDKEYTVTAIGLSNGNALKEISDGTISINDLSNGWQTFIEAPSGELTINSFVTSGVVVDDSLTTKYGTLTKSGNNYTYEQNGSNTLESIEVSEVAATFPATSTSATIKANNATFTLTAIGDFTIDATSSIPGIEDASAINLTAGTIAAEKDVPVTVGKKTITATNGDMTVGIDSSYQVFVGDLNAGDTFTVGNTNYEVTSAGQLYDTSNKQIVTSGYADGTFIVDNSIGDRIIAPSGTTLDLNNETQNALVYNSVENPTTKLADLTVTGTRFELKGTDDNTIKTVKIADGSNLTVDFVSQVKVTSGIVNGQAYNGTNELTINATATTSTLYAGTITLDTTIPSAKATNDSTELEVTSGTITAKAKAGKFTEISGLDTGETFTFGGKEYTMTAIGLSNGTEIKEISDGKVSINDLSKDWQTVIEAPNSELTIDSSVTSGVVVDDSLTTKYGTLKKSGNNYTYTQNGSNTLDSIEVIGIKATFPSSAASALITANDATLTLTATDKFTIDAKANIPNIDGANAINLTKGTIFAPSEVTVTLGDYEITATNGKMTVGWIDDNVTVSELNTGDTFKVGETSYEMTTVGLYDAANQKMATSGVSDDLTTFTLDDAEFGDVVALDTDSNLDLSTKPATYPHIIFVAGRDDSGEIDPTKSIANVTYDDEAYQLDAGSYISELKSVTLGTVKNFNTDVETVVHTPSENYTINDKTFVAQTNLEITTGKDTAKLAKGTVALAAGSEIATANDTIAATTGTISVAVDDDVTIGNLSTGKEFSVNDKDYMVTAIGLITGDTLKEISDGAVSISNLSKDWQTIIEAPNGELTIDSSVTSGVVVDDSLTTKYGTLTKSGNNYSYTQNGSNTLNSIEVSGVSATFPATSANATITANNATFTLTASGDDFTINAASSIPDIDGASAINLTAGTISAKKYIPVTIGKKTITATNGDMTIGINSSYQVFVSELNSGDTFTVGDTHYEITSTGQLYDTDNKQIVTEGYSDGTFIIDDALFGEVIALDTDGNLNLTTKPATYPYTVFVAGRDSSGEIDPTKSIANVIYDGEAYQLDAASDISELKSVTLGTVKNFNTDVETVVYTPSGTYTINDKPFAAQTNLEIITGEATAKLVKGTVAVAAGSEVDTPDDTIAATTGTISVEVGDDVTVGNLSTGKEFSVNNKEYSMTAIGLSDGEYLKEIDNSITVKDLNDDDWQTILAAPKGELTLDSTATDGAIVADVTDPSKAIKYGTLAKSGTAYTFTQNGSNKLTSIILNGVAATFPADSASASISTNSADFSLTASGNFTVDTTTDITEIDGANSIALTLGTLEAPSNVPINIGTKTITATNGAMNVGLNDNKVVISELNNGDTFSVGSTNYSMTKAGLFDAENQQIVTKGVSDDLTTFTLDDAAFGRIITPSGNSLNLTGETSDALVYDSKTNPTTLLAELTVAGDKYTLDGTDDNTIKTITIANGSTLDADFAATVNASGSVTVNDVDYKGTGSLVINSDGKTSTLYQGTITLDPTIDAPKATNDNAQISINNGTVKATAANGKFTTLSELDTTESFTYNRDTYTQSKFGLLKDNLISEDLTGSTIELSKLSSATWSDFLAPVNATLDLSGISDSAIVYDDADNPTSKIAILTVSSNDKLILNGESNASKEITTIVIDDDANLTVDFATQVSTTSGTVNNQTYNGNGDLVIDANSKSSSLYSGSITLDSNNRSAKATKDSTALTVTKGSITAVATLGKFIEVGDLNAGDTFTYEGKTYTQTEFGLVTSGTVSEDLKGSTVDLTLLPYATWYDLIAPVNGTLNLSNVKNSCSVFDSTTNPTTHLATLTVDDSTLILAGERNASDSIKTVKVAKDSDLTLDFAAQVSAPSGSVTVNAKTYDATTAITLDSDGKTSKLTSGTVNIAPADSVTTTNGSRTIANTGNESISLTASSSTLTVGNLAKDSDFTVDDNEYMVTAATIFKTDSKDNPQIYTGATDVIKSGSITVADLDSDSWGNIFRLDDAAALHVTNTIGGLKVVGDNTLLVSNDLNEFYGTLTKTPDGYSLTKLPTAKSDLSAIYVDDTQLELSSDFTSTPLTVDGSEFSDMVLDANKTSFIAKNESSYPVLENLASFTLKNGKTYIKTTDANHAEATVADNKLKATNGALGITYDGNTVTLGEVATNSGFTLNDDDYNMSSFGLIRDGQISEDLQKDTMTLNEIAAANWNDIFALNDGVIDLTDATGNAIVYDDATNPTKKIAALTLEDGKFNLSGTPEELFTVKIAADTDYTIDFEANVEAPIGSVTVNGNSYNATTDVEIYGDGTTSALEKGTVALAKDDSVTTKAGDNIIVATDGDGLTVTAQDDSVKISGLNTGDAFTVGGEAYKVGAIGILEDGKLYTGENYSDGVTVDALGDDSNWTALLGASYATFAVDAGTLDDGEKVILVDDIANPTITYGTLTKSDGEYLLMKDDTKDEFLSGITVAGTIINIDTELAKIPITT